MYILKYTFLLDVILLLIFWDVVRTLEISLGTQNFFVQVEKCIVMDSGMKFSDT